MNEECPIVPNEAIKLTYGDEEDDYLLVAASHDTVHIFPDDKYNYLRYFDAREDSVKAIWLQPEVLEELVESGIPATYRENITQSEYDCYLSYVGRTAITQIVEVDPIDTEVAKATSHMDAELDYFLKEWE